MDDDSKQQRRPRAYLATIFAAIAVGVATGALLVLASGGFSHSSAGPIAAPPAGRIPHLKFFGPPPAWVEWKQSKAWLAYSSYCWRTTCVGYVKPNSPKMHLPQVAIKAGDTLSFHLSFEPVDVLVKQGGEQTSLAPSEIVTWTPKHPGIVLLAVTSHDGAASYALRLRISR